MDENLSERRVDDKVTESQTSPEEGQSLNAGETAAETKSETGQSAKPGARDTARRRSRSSATWNNSTLRIVTAAVAGVFLMVAVPVFFAYGDRLTLPFFYAGIVVLAFCATLILFIVTNSTSVLQGTIPGTSLTLHVVGAASFFPICVGLLWWWAPKPVFQTVHVYAVTDAQGGAGKIDRFKILYRRPKVDEIFRRGSPSTGPPPAPPPPQ